MGRGLSALQRSILRLALHNRTAEGPGHDRGPGGLADVFAWEVLAAAYGFAHSDRYGLSRATSPIFDRARIGPRRFEAARVATRVAFDRLAGRELATTRAGTRWHAYGLSLTAQGIEAAEGLMATKSFAPGPGSTP